MSRDIRFRAWDKEHEEITDFKTLPLYIDDINFAWDEYEFMQFTGLYDRRKREIFEDDVVQVIHPYKNRKHTGRIIFKNGRFMLEGFWMPHLDCPDDFTHAIEYAEVIGNVWEHPHLLEGSVEDE